MMPLQGHGLTHVRQTAVCNTQSGERSDILISDIDIGYKFWTLDFGGRDHQGFRRTCCHRAAPHFRCRFRSGIPKVKVIPPCTEADLQSTWRGKSSGCSLRQKPGGSHASSETPPCRHTERSHIDALIKNVATEPLATPDPR